MPIGKTVGETIVEYLEQLPVDELTAKDVWPPDATQDGIARAIGKTRAHISLELRRLMARGQVERHMVHVVGGKTRRYVYRPSIAQLIFDHEGDPVPIAKGELRTIQVVHFRCPRCGSKANVALET